jgi:TIR domain
MPVAEGGGIFISYRRKQSKDFAGRLSDRLADRFGEGQVFMDVDAIEPGVDFAEEISHAVAACKVLLAVIGPGWLTAADERGRRRLDNPDDFVRLEIEAALARDVRVIPILVEHAVMPGQEDLPESLAGLARRQALRMWHESFHSDADRLATVIERELAMASGTAPVRGAADTPGVRSPGTADESSVEVSVRNLAIRYDVLRETMLSGDRRTVRMADVVRELRNVLKEVPDFDVAKYLSSSDRGLRLGAYAYLLEHKASQYRSELVRVACDEDKPFGQYHGLDALRNQGQTAERLTEDDLSKLSSLAQRLGPGEEQRDRANLINGIIALERSKS